MSPLQWLDSENTGCEHYIHVDHIDEMALNSEMGLYFDFKIKDKGFPYGCPGFEQFSPQTKEKTMQGVGWFLNHISTIPDANCTGDGINGGTYSYTCEAGKKKSDPQCNLNQMQVPKGSTPLYAIFEEYASSQAKWIEDFIPAFEKMQSNGYASEALTNGPDQYTNVVCPRPSPGKKNWKYECQIAQA